MTNTINVSDLHLKDAVAVLIKIHGNSIDRKIKLVVLCSLKYFNVRLVYNMRGGPIKKMCHVYVVNIKNKEIKNKISWCENSKQAVKDKDHMGGVGSPKTINFKDLSSHYWKS